MNINRNAIKIDKLKKYEYAKKIFYRISKIIHIMPNYKILDVGCGGGELLKIIHENTNAECYGVEPYPPKYGFVYNKEKIFNAVAEKLPFNDIILI